MELPSLKFIILIVSCFLFLYFLECGEPRSPTPLIVRNVMSRSPRCHAGGVRRGMATLQKYTFLYKHSLFVRKKIMLAQQYLSFTHVWDGVTVAHTFAVSAISNIAFMSNTGKQNVTVFCFLLTK